MNDLSADARALIAQAKTSDNPSRADRARVRQKLAASWAAQQAFAGTSNRFEETDVLRTGTESSRWLWASLTTTALSVVFGLWIVLRPQAPSSPVIEPSRATDTTQDQVAPAAIATESEARFARDPEPASEPEAAEPARKATKSRAPANPRTRKSAPAASDATALDDIVEPETHAERKATPPSAAGDNTRSATPAPAASSAEGEPGAPVAREAATTQRARASGNTKPVDAEDLAPPKTAPKFVAQPIDDELALLGAAQEALQNHQPSLALRLVQHHGFRFPRGALAHERIAVQTLALCALHRPSEARQILGELARRAPNSPLLERVRRSCGFEADDGSH